MRTWLRAFGILISSIGVTAVVEAQDHGADIVKQVLNTWQKRRDAMKAVRYKIEGVETYAKGVFRTPDPGGNARKATSYPPTDMSFPKQAEYTIDFRTGKIRKDQRYHIYSSPLGMFRPEVAIMLFDGEEARIAYPREDNTSDVYTPPAHQPELKLYKGGAKLVLTQDDYPLLFAHGCPPFYNTRIDAIGYFDRPVNAALLRYHQRGVIRDRSCIVLRTVPEGSKWAIFDEYWVDLDHDGAILRWQAYSLGTPYSRYEVEYSQIEGHWLPSGWKFDLFSSDSGNVTFTRGERMSITTIDINPQISSQTFSSPRKHGMVVSDTQGNLVVVGSDGKTLVPYGVSTYVWRWWHLLVCVACCVIVASGLCYWLRHRAKASA